MKWRPKGKANVAGPSVSGRKTKKDVLKIVLQHGDIMLMHGEGIQQLYEVSSFSPGLSFDWISKHGVDPLGNLRFVLTSRYIRPETMETDEDRIYSEQAGAFPEGFDYEYDGSVEPVIAEPMIWDLGSTWTLYFAMATYEDTISLGWRTEHCMDFTNISSEGLISGGI